jgi:hypothetical protein
MNPIVPKTVKFVFQLELETEGNCNSGENVLCLRLESSNSTRIDIIWKQNVKNVVKLTPSLILRCFWLETWLKSWWKEFFVVRETCKVRRFDEVMLVPKRKEKPGFKWSDTNTIGQEDGAFNANKSQRAHHIHVWET